MKREQIENKGLSENNYDEKNQDIVKYIAPEDCPSGLPRSVN